MGVPYTAQKFIMPSDGDEKADALDAVIEDLVQWELDHESNRDLENFYFTKMKFYYHDNPDELTRALKEREEITWSEGEIE